ncbi:MAG: hypothetical protein A2Y78_00075 [Acidobacteria bacterium RBG_13_68_16]|nr:MAG: hypothetical protein A2Y78_00075 [Acidobacteria bacterium RBG_13_68_16]
MGTVIAIDPGIAVRGPGCAVATFRDGVLVGVGFLRPSSSARHIVGVTTVYEIPIVRPREDLSSGKANTLIKLAAAGAELAGRFGGCVVAVEPAAWKGSTPKPVSHSRIWSALTDAERILFEPDTERRIELAKRAGGLARWSKPGATYYGTWAGHNLLDAAGIGLHFLGRKS